MKLTKFLKQFTEGKDTLSVVDAREPIVLVRHGRDGREYGVEALKVRRDKGKGVLIIEVAEQYPTEDAFMAAMRATNWRNAQLRANGIEPITLPPNAPHEPPARFDFRGVQADEMLRRDAKVAA